MMKATEDGFTLLEILVALTIVGMITGTLFALLGGSKRLAASGKDAVVRTLASRMLIRAVSLDRVKDARGAVNDVVSFKILDVQVPFPPRKTKPLHNILEKKIIKIADREITVWTWRYSPSAR